MSLSAHGAEEVLSYAAIDPVDGTRYLNVVHLEGDARNVPLFNSQVSYAEEAGAGARLCTFDFRRDLRKREGGRPEEVRMSCSDSNPARRASWSTEHKDRTDPFRAVYLSDTHFMPERILPLEETILRFSPDVILHGGDVGHGSNSWDQWAGFFRTFERILRAAPLLATFGNHEYMPDLGDRHLHWREHLRWNLDQFITKVQAVNDGYYPSVLLSPASIREKRHYGVVRFGAVEVFVLDSNLAVHSNGRTAIAPAQVPYLMEQSQWLQRELERSSHDPAVRFRLALYHWPAFGSDRLVTSLRPFRRDDGKTEHLLFDGKPYDYLLDFLYGVGNLPEAIDPTPTSDDYAFRYLVPQFEKYGVQLVLNGHVHRFGRDLLRRTSYLTAGTVGGTTLDTYQEVVGGLDTPDYRKRAEELWSWRPDLRKEEIDRYADIHPRKSPSLDRTVTFLRASDRALEVYTCSLNEGHPRKIDDFLILADGNVLESKSYRLRTESEGPCEPPT